MISRLNKRWGFSIIKREKTKSFIGLPFDVRYPLACNHPAYSGDAVESIL